MRAEGSAVSKEGHSAELVCVLRIVEGPHDSFEVELDDPCVGLMRLNGVDDLRVLVDRLESLEASCLH